VCRTRCVLGPPSTLFTSGDCLKFIRNVCAAVEDANENPESFGCQGHKDELKGGGYGKRLASTLDKRFARKGYPTPPRENGLGDKHGGVAAGSTWAWRSEPTGNR
jgi:hypothetical protein